MGKIAIPALIVLALIALIAFSNSFGKANELRAQGDMGIKLAEADLIREQVKRYAIRTTEEEFLYQLTREARRVGEVIRIYGLSFSMIVVALAGAIAISYYLLSTARNKALTPILQLTKGMTIVTTPTTGMSVIYKGDVNPFPSAVITRNGCQVCTDQLSQLLINAVIAGNTTILVAEQARLAESGHDKTVMFAQLMDLIQALGQPSITIAKAKSVEPT